ncbi:sarcosine oxidase subunit delta [Falsihalocynthiibacter sp. SS001]|uniref:sarcosine oxidase subunit delta n=1 Tax=Falsihalocynthiibacter sp. SS001 TaxID=3349698 RepID=UPI0036D418CD
MLTLKCPYCGVQADETELSAGGEAHVSRALPDSDDSTLANYLFYRENPRGVHFERWRHSNGCGKWFHAARNTMTLEVYGTYSAQVFGPKEEIIARIQERHPDWTPEAEAK